MGEAIECTRCQGKGTIQSPRLDGSFHDTECPICLGLGTTPPKRRRPPNDHHSVAVHCTHHTLAQLIARLPEGEPTTYE